MVRKKDTYPLRLRNDDDPRIEKFLNSQTGGYGDVIRYLIEKEIATNGMRDLSVLIPSKRNIDTLFNHPENKLFQDEVKRLPIENSPAIQERICVENEVPQKYAPKIIEFEEIVEKENSLNKEEVAIIENKKEEQERILVNNEGPEKSEPSIIGFEEIVNNEDDLNKEEVAIVEEDKDDDDDIPACYR